jgi:hypothetical protein
MLYAMFNSESWRDNVLDYPAPTLFKDGLRMFYDFSHNPDMVTYHSPLFWEYVLEAWKTTDVDGKDLFQLIFGKDYEEVRKFTEDDGLHLLAHGYSWKTLISWNLTLYEYKRLCLQHPLQLPIRQQPYHNLSRCNSGIPRRHLPRGDWHRLQRSGHSAEEHSR